MVVLIFDVLFWMYAAYAWLTNMAPPDRPARRLLLMVGMAGFLFCALAVPRAFDSGGVAFGATAPRWTWTAPAACASSTGWCSRSISDLSTRQPRWPTTSPNGAPPPKLHGTRDILMRLDRSVSADGSHWPG